MKEFEIQRDFIKSIMNDDISDERLKIYKLLVYNNIEDTLTKAFPITKKFLENHWENIVETFIKEHPLNTPYLWELPADFIAFVKAENLPDKYNIPFLLELLEYEWIEIEIFNKDLPENQSEFSWDKRFFLSSTAILKSFQYPVHRLGSITEKDLIKHKGNYHLVIYLSPEDYEVSYIEITDFLYDLLSKISEDKLLKVSTDILNRYNYHPDTEIFSKLENFFKMLIEEKIIV